MFEVLNYVHENITQPLTILDVANHFGYSKWYFCKKFREFKGVTFGEYVRHYRIQLAAIDILQGRKITDVAMHYGYDTVGGFNKAFLKEYGCLPREYKKVAKECQLYYEWKENSMYKLSDRCNIIRNEVVNKKSYMNKYFLQRIVYLVNGAADAASQNMSYDEIMAEGVANIINKFTPFIVPGELITGFNYGDAEFGDSYVPKDNPKDREYMKQNNISDVEIEKFFAADDKYKSSWFWVGLGFVHDSVVELSEEERWAGKERSSLGRCTCANHTVIGYEKVLRMGFDGILKEIESFENINGTNDTYKAMKKVCSSAMIIGEKYAEEAERLLKLNDSLYNKEDLEIISRVCSRVPKYPATSFVEAVQALWFTHIINTWEDVINANSLGRLDQILYPYYKSDIEKGVLTKEDAFEILGCLWLKLYRDYDVQQSCVGGTLPDGTSAVNELSYMMLDVTERLDFIRCLSVRYSQNTEKSFLKRAMEVVGHVQKGIPFFFNDDVMIPALVSKGIDRIDAYDYTQLGCIETVIPGKCNPHAVSGETNFLKAIEYVLCNGRSMVNPEFRPGVHTGELNEFDTYDKFYDAVIKQIDRILDLTCSQTKKYSDVCVAPKPFKSILTAGCIEKGRDFNDKGSVYDYYQIMLGAVPNLADSLMVIKKFVYQERKYTLSEMKKMLEENYPDEKIRMEFVNKSPKFGNDIDEVDSLAADIVNHACDYLVVLSEKYGLDFHAQPFTYFWMIDYGDNSAASPDGRRAGEPVAYSASPMQGRDFNGLTATLNSISKMPTKRTPGTTSAIVEVDPKLFTDKNIDSLTDILIAAGKKGLSNVQFNTIDAETLINAKNNPEKYNNLAVRVSGFSQKFNLLTPELQEHIIGRTKHICL